MKPMRDVTAALEELHRLASELEDAGRYTEADALHGVFLKLAAPQQPQRRKKRGRRRLTPFGYATLGLPAYLLMNQFLGMFGGEGDPQPQAAPQAVSQPAPAQPPVKPPAPNFGDFTKFKRFTMPEEGGFVHRKRSADPGGATNMGVTQGTYNEYRDRIGRPRQSVKKITPDEAKTIMRDMYWKPMRGGELPERTALALADMGYLEGPQDAIRSLQKLVGAPQTGVLGPITLKKTWEYAATPDKDVQLALKLTQIREERLRSRPHADENPGWFNRTERMKEFVQNEEEFPKNDLPKDSPPKR